MDWIRAHLPSYSNLNTGHSLTSSMSSQSQSNGNGQQQPPPPPSMYKSRFIRVNSEHQSHKYCTNEISTCKYNAITFFPRFLLEQFRRYSNIFFLCIAILQQIPEVSPTGRYTTAVPFFIILSISALKEAFEDIKRRRMDKKVNNYRARVLRGSKFEICRWHELNVGQIVKVLEGHNFPADIVLLASSEEMGMAYIETAQLDGETNLKIRQALPITADFVSVDQLCRINAEIECEPPNKKVNEFTGTMQMGNQRLPLSIQQFLLRGAKLKNCKWVYGVVIYTGHDSRLLMNSTAAPLKTSRIDTMTNRRTVILFLLLIAITFVSVIGAEFMSRYLENAFYLQEFKVWTFFWNVLTFFILYNNLIPISLQVTLEIVRFFQAGYINQDLKMYDEQTDTPANARTSNLNEELGQVQYLMTDKTGTLTRNVMKFKRCQIGASEYGDDEDEEFDGRKMLRDMAENEENAELIYEFLLMMASCHTVVPERTEEGELNFQATSPDEGALVRGAAANGFIFHTRRPTEIRIETPRGEAHMQLLNVLEFTSDRKRMSVIVRDSQRNRIKLYCKGADNAIFERLSKEHNPAEVLNRADRTLGEYARKGYRTLCFAMVELDEQQYADWSHEFGEASTALVKREEKVAAAAEKVERSLRLVGVTAIEDKLQENVPQTIQTLLSAGIRIWMLTGDKLETAVQIAQSSSICSKDTELLKLVEKSYDAVLTRLQQFKGRSQQLLASNAEFALVLDGASLHHAVIGEARRIFGELIVTCHSVVCCRMTPIQKAEIVDIVKTLGNSTVLAVGDGANDVAMIQVANVGVGITGEEGLQAASASDYSIAQFQFLQQLILVHGTWNYERTVKVILYSFYKNICLYIIELWFAFFSAFSGVTIFERWTIALFNIFFTGWPPIILGLFDRPISQRDILNNPKLYQSFQQMAFSNYRFTLWICVSVWHSLVLMFLSYWAYGAGVVWETGRNGGWLMFGNYMFSHVVATVCWKALLESDTLNWVIVVMCNLSIFFWFLFLFLYSLVWPTLSNVFPIGAEMGGMFTLLVTSPNFWMSFIFIPITTLLFDFVAKSVCTTFYPSPRERLCMREKKATVGCHITDMEGRRFEEVRPICDIESRQHQQRVVIVQQRVIVPERSVAFTPKGGGHQQQQQPHSHHHHKNSTSRTSLLIKENNHHHNHNPNEHSSEYHTITFN